VRGGLRPYSRYRYSRYRQEHTPFVAGRFDGERRAFKVAWVLGRYSVYQHASQVWLHGDRCITTLSMKFKELIG
jgi:hypothetical protein